MADRAKQYKRKTFAGVKKFSLNKSAEGTRPNANERGYDYRWQQARAHFLHDNPLCMECAKVNRVEAATVVDHKIPHRGDEELFWALSNWQALCETCHNRKTGKGS